VTSANQRLLDKLKALSRVACSDLLDHVTSIAQKSQIGKTLAITNAPHALAPSKSLKANAAQNLQLKLIRKNSESEKSLFAHPIPKKSQASFRGLTSRAQAQPPSGTSKNTITNKFHKSIATGRGSGCCLQREPV
jgi:hypothetical protein